MRADYVRLSQELGKSGVLVQGGVQATPRASAVDSFNAAGD